MSAENILVEDEAGVRLITINRPHKKNAITKAMYAAMAEAVNSAQADDDLRVVLFTGAGDAFTAGNDMVDFVSSGGNMDDDAPVVRFLHAILNAKKPLMAAVNGLAIGVGATMLLHCDLVYASDNASFSMPFINLGLMPEAASSLMLPFAVGSKKAAQMFMLGDKHSAAEALDMGLITGIFAPDRLMDEAKAVAQALARKPPKAMLLVKELLKRAPESPIERMGREGAMFAQCLGGDEFKEAAAAFFEKRDPDFSKS